MRARRGSALIMAMMVVLVVVGLVVALAPVVRVDVRAAGHAADNQRALYLARGGVNLALAALQQDDPSVDGLDEDWATLGQQGQYAYPLGQGQFRLQVIDASSLLDINQADQATLQLLPGIDPTTVDAILAWRGQTGTNNTAGGSSEDYESLPRPYREKAAPFDSVEELLLVQGVTPLLLYGSPDGSVVQNQLPWIDLLSVDTVSPNTDQNGRPRINVRTATAQQLVTQLRLTQPQARALAGAGTLAQAVRALGPRAQQLIDRLTVTAGTQLMGKVNINTAPAEVLETLPGMTQELAEQIVQQRESSDFQSLGDLMNLSQTAFSSLVDRVTTKSSTFLVRARGELPNGTIQAVEATVRRTGQNLQVTRWRVVPETPGWANWGWDNGTAASAPTSSPSPTP